MSAATILSQDCDGDGGAGGDGNGESTILSTAACVLSSMLLVGVPVPTAVPSVLLVTAADGVGAGDISAVLPPAQNISSSTTEAAAAACSRQFMLLPAIQGLKPSAATIADLQGGHKVAGRRAPRPIQAVQSSNLTRVGRLEMSLNRHGCRHTVGRPQSLANR